MIVTLMIFILAACGSSDATTRASVDAVVPTNTTTAAVEPDVDASEEPETASDTPADAERSSEATPVNTKLNLNAASGDDYLSAIPNFNNRMVREFLEYRPYINIQQFRREIGKYVDQTQVAEWEQYVYVPIDVDESDAETLMQLPGVDDTIAAELIAARPFGSNEVFLTKLAEYVSSAEVSVAETYLAAQ